MKKLLFLLFFIPLVSFGQIFDYNDLKDINSEKQFKRFSFEKEFIKTDEGKTYLTYAQLWNKEEDKAVIWSYYYRKTGLFSFQIVKNRDGSSSDSFNRVLEQVKNKCTFYDIKEVGSGEYKKEFICYTCPGSAFPGKIGFARDDSNDYIETFTDFK
jgi:hypothetical protein